MVSFSLRVPTEVSEIGRPPKTGPGSKLVYSRDLARREFSNETAAVYRGADHQDAWGGRSNSVPRKTGLQLGRDGESLFRKCSGFFGLKWIETLKRIDLN